jgi:hypothetical protein
MRRRIFAFPGIGCVLLALVSASPANAAIATRQSGSFVIATAVWQYGQTLLCGLYEWVYLQRMIIDGVSALIPTSWVLPPGRYALTLITTCDGYNIYGVDSCVCIGAATDDVQAQPDAKTANIRGVPEGRPRSRSRPIAPSRLVARRAPFIGRGLWHSYGDAREATAGIGQLG